VATLRLGLRVVIGAHRSSPSLSRSVSSRSRAENAVWVFARSLQN
jgi:hypothetical protein